MPFSETFKQQLERLRDRAGEARQMGLSDEEITQITSQVGDWLAREAEPRTYEQRLLKELWNVCDEEGKHLLSSALLQVAEKEPSSSLGGHTRGDAH